jgi:uncharacterized protein (TIGR03000 family)
MSPRSSLLLRRAGWTATVLMLGWGVAGDVRAQVPEPAGPPGGYREPGPITPEIYEAGGGQQRTSTGQSTSNPVLAPGYFEVVCPAICYGGAFHVCGVRAFGGPGYYGPFRRYWAYSTYGPNFNIGPDNSLQYGLQSGVMYVATRHGKGCYKYGSDCACHCALCTKGGSAAAAYGPIAQLGILAGTAQQRPEQLPQPTPNSARLRLVVPENAEVLVEGRKTTTTGTVREFVSPPLEPGKNMIYSIVVRYTDAHGKPVEQTHAVRVRANDQLHLDCTPPSPARARAGSPLRKTPDELPQGERALEDAVPMATAPPLPLSAQTLRVED